MSVMYPGTRAGRRTRKLWNQARRDVLRSLWQPVAAASVVLIAVIGGLVWCMNQLIDAPFYTGAIFGGAVVGYFASLHWIVDAWSGQHNNKVGTRGEEATSDAFRSRAMRRRGWRIFDSVAFDAAFGDVDHVAVRPGLVVAVETKWAGTPWRIEDGRLEVWGDPLHQVRNGARKIRLLLKEDVDVVVHPIVVVWGPGADALPDDVNDVDGVLILHGRGIAALDEQLDPFMAEHPSEAEVPVVMGVIKAYARKRDGHASTAAESGARGHT